MRFKTIKARILIVLLILLVIFPYQVLAEKKLEPIMSLSFNNIEPLMMSRYQVILDNVKTYNDLNNGQRDVQSGTSNTNDLLVTLSKISSADPAVQSLITVVAQLLHAQYQMAVGTNSMAQSTSITNVGLQTEQGNYTIVYNMESAFITYNGLIHQIEDMKAKKPLLEKQLNLTKLQKQLGMTTEAALLSAESQLVELETGIQQLEQAKKALKQTFNTNLAQEYDTDINILEVPDVSNEVIAAIKVDEDYKEALKKSYNVRLNNRDIDKENDAKRNFEKGFYTAYQTILDKQKSLVSEKNKLAVAEKNFKTADLKLKLGIMSSIQYQSEYSNYISKKMAVEKAEDTLFQAFRAYEWAKRGLIVSGGAQ